MKSGLPSRFVTGTLLVKNRPSGHRSRPDVSMSAICFLGAEWHPSIEPSSAIPTATTPPSAAGPLPNAERSIARVFPCTRTDFRSNRLSSDKRLINSPSFELKMSSGLKSASSVGFSSISRRESCFTDAVQSRNFRKARACSSILLISCEVTACRSAVCRRCRAAHSPSAQRRPRPA